MSLYKKVLLKNQLSKLPVDSVKEELTRLLNELAFITEDSNYTVSSIPTVFDAIDSLTNNLNELNHQLNRDIETYKEEYKQKSYDAFDYDQRKTTEFRFGPAGDPNSNLDLSFFKSRLSKYADWKHPAMIIRPGNKSFIEDMVAFDPLYLVDTSHELLLPALGSFGIDYRKRLRSYTIHEQVGQEILNSLPDNQFGLVFAYNFMSFRPIEILEQYLKEVYQKLKPGGTFIFTFNNCDFAYAVELVNLGFGCYTPGNKIYDIAKNIGYELEYTWHDHRATTWLELRKPGTLSSLKGGQTLAKIVPKQL